jgi:hypothetical protein
LGKEKIVSRRHHGQATVDTEFFDAVMLVHAGARQHPWQQQ